MDKKIFINSQRETGKKPINNRPHKSETEHKINNTQKVKLFWDQLSSIFKCQRWITAAAELIPDGSVSRSICLLHVVWSTDQINMSVWLTCTSTLQRPLHWTTDWKKLRKKNWEMLFSLRLLPGYAAHWACAVAFLLLAPPIIFTWWCHRVYNQSVRGACCHKSSDAAVWK